MKANIYWIRFLKKLREDIQKNKTLQKFEIFPIYYGEFTCKRKKYRIKLIIEKQ